jgi:hypothetical protein
MVGLGVMEVFLLLLCCWDLWEATFELYLKYQLWEYINYKNNINKLYIKFCIFVLLLYILINYEYFGIIEFFNGIY